MDKTPKVLDLKEKVATIEDTKAKKAQLVASLQPISKKRGAPQSSSGQMVDVSLSESDDEEASPEYWDEDEFGLQLGKVIGAIEQKDGKIVDVVKRYWHKHKHGEAKVKAEVQRIEKSKWLLFCVTDRECDRPETINFTAKRDSKIKDQILGKIKQHDGEVRVWPADAQDLWIGTTTRQLVPPSVKI